MANNLLALKRTYCDTMSTTSHTVTISNTQFTRMLDELATYKAQTKQLKQVVNRLESENKFNNQLLDEKSTHIISCTSENIVLRKEIESLKKELKILSKRKKKCKKSKSKQLKLILQDKQLNNLSDISTDIDSCEIQENIPMPYLMTSVSSASVQSAQSAQACTLSLPATPILPTERLSLLILNPIAESNENSADQYTFSPITPITPIINESNNNYDIQTDEWDESVATISPQMAATPKTINGSVHFVSDISLEADDEDSVISMSGESESDYYGQQPHGDGEVFMDYSDSDVVFAQKKAPIANTDENKYDFPRAISVLSELSDVGHDTDGTYYFD